MKRLCFLDKMVVYGKMFKLMCKKRTVIGLMIVDTIKARRNKAWRQHIIIS